MIALAVTATVSLTVLGLTRLGPDALDTYRADAVSFFERFRLGGAAEEAEFYDSLSEASASATAVVVAEVVDVRQTRVIVGELATDQVPMVGVTLRPVEVLAGSLREQDTAELTVEFLGDESEPDQQIQEMKAAMPEGQAVWFLRYKGENAPQIDPEMPVNEQQTLEGDRKYYRVQFSQGLLIQGESGVVAPMAESDPVGMATEAESFDTMSDLIDMLRRQ